VIDLHCHILPGLDDGAESWEQSLQMARIAAEDGISGIVCTPHCSPGFPENKRASILASVKEFRTRLRREGIRIEVYPGSELAIHFALPEKIEAGEFLSINDNRTFALVEMPYEVIPPNLDKLFWMMQVKGVTPILAHPERNLLVLKRPLLLEKWIEAGVLVQITGSSLVGFFGSSIRDFSTELVRRRMVHFVATDSHSSGQRRPVLSKAREIVSSIVGPEEAREIFVEHPSRVLRGEFPAIREPLPPENRNTSFMRRSMSTLGRFSAGLGSLCSTVLARFRPTDRK